MNPEPATGRQPIETRSNVSPLASAGCSWRRKDRWAFRRLGFFLNLDLGRQYCGRDGGYRNVPRLCATEPIEHLWCVAGGDDLAERGQWSPDQVNAPHELVRPPVDVDPVDHNRRDLE